MFFGHNSVEIIDDFFDHKYRNIFYKSVEITVIVRNLLQDGQLICSDILLQDSRGCVTGNLGDDSIQNWMMNALSVNNLLAENKEVHHRILLESIPSNGAHLSRFIEAMKACRRVTVNYRKYGSDEANSRTVDPYCIKLFNRRWYALVRHLQKGTLFMLAFDRIEQPDITDGRFALDNIIAETLTL